MVFPSGFSKRSFVLEVNSQQGDGQVYKDFLEFETLKTFTSIVDLIKVGDDVEVEFTLGGRLWTDPKNGQEKCFVSLKCWDVVVLSKKEERLSFQQETPVEEEVSFAGADEDFSDLPF